MSKRLNAKIKKGFLAAIFLLVLCIGTVCFADEISGTVMGDSCNIRETSDANGRIIGNAKKNSTVSIVGEVTGTDGKQWYQIWVDGSTKGYIRADLVQKNDAAALTQATTAAPTEQLESTQATPVDEKAGTVNTNNVRIRKGASTKHDVVATANKGMSLIVTGEANGNDGKKWYQVKFSYNNKDVVGFIRADLVTFGSVPADTAVSEITGSQVQTPEQETQTEEITTEPQTEETVEQPAEETEQPESNSNSSSEMTLMNTTEVPYMISGFEPIILKWNDQDINAFKNGDFYIFYAQNQTGEQGWYVFDSEKGTYQRYAYSIAGVEAKEGNLLEGNLIPIIILVVIIVILLATVGLMFIKLKEYTSDVYEEDDEDDVEEDELEEEEIEEINEPVQKPVRKQKTQRVVHEENTNYDRPVRKQAPSQDAQRPARRPNQESEQGVPQQRRTRIDDANTDRRPERPVRRTDVGVPARREGDRPVRKSNGENVRRRPQGEPEYRRPSGDASQKHTQRTTQQQGYRAQNFLENEDKDDIEFIDL